jgi:hypothetical protein
MTYLNESNEKEVFDISENILALSDELSEEIILTNIGDQLSSRMDIFTDKKNYLTLFREKYGIITSKNSYYDKYYLKDALIRVTNLVKDALYSRYGVTLGNELDFYSPGKYLEDIETLYEFLFIRNFSNLVNYFISEVQKQRPTVLEKYEKHFSGEDFNKDIFVTQYKKKFKYEEDIVIIHYINEIIDDIKDSKSSAYILFESIIALDPFEEFNSKAGELLNDYGKGMAFQGDQECYSLYMAPLKNKDIKTELRNAIIMKLLETIEVENDA